MRAVSLAVLCLAMMACAPVSQRSWPESGCSSGGGALLGAGAGALAGGLLGNSTGRQKGRGTRTAGGAVAGGLLGAALGAALVPDEPCRIPQRQVMPDQRFYGGGPPMGWQPGPYGRPEMWAPRSVW